MKKDNKGFSLVELIVVVLIMAIIAVALAPQVLRWVENSRVSNDFQVMGTVMTAADAALATEKGNKAAKTAGTVKILVQSGGVTYNGVSAPNDFITAFEKNVDLNTLKTKATEGKITVVISGGITQPRGRDTGNSTYEYNPGGGVTTIIESDID